MRRYGHHTIRYVSIQRQTIWLFSILYDTIRIIIVKNINIHNVHIYTNIHNVHIYTNIHNVHILLFMNTTRNASTSQFYKHNGKVYKGIRQNKSIC